MTIQTGSRVELHYDLLDEHGHLVESTADEGPVRYVHGQGEILPGLERALEGAAAGTRLDVELEPDEAYGAYDPEGLVSVPRSEMPEDLPLSRGDWISVHVEEDEEESPEFRAGGEDESLEEGEMEMRVVEVGADEVVLDANHPLAGQRVTFRVTVASVH